MSKKINIDGVEYDLDSLSQEAKAILGKLQHTDTQIKDNNQSLRSTNSGQK